MASNILSINFSTNWNKKLDCNLFTTIRGIDEYYSNNFFKGSIADCKLNKTSYCKAKVVSKGIVKFSAIPQIVVMLDTGYSYEASLDLFSHFLQCSKEELKNKDVVFLTLEKL